MIKRIISLIKGIYNNIINLDLLTKENMLTVLLEDRIMSELPPSLVSKEVKKKNVVISLTTYSKRINNVHLVIESLGRQTILADRIILWLDEEEFNFETLPLVIRNQMERGLEVRFCSNLKSYKKLIPSIKLNINSSFITVDDDIIYPVDFVEVLYNDSIKYPDVVISNQAHFIKFDRSEIDKYTAWDLSTASNEISFSSFPVGACGVLYPPGCFDSQVIDESIFMELAPDADDIWFKVMTVINGVKSKKVDDSRDIRYRFIPISSGQDIALYHNNVSGGQNDIQIKKILEFYNLKSNVFK